MNRLVLKLLCSLALVLGGSARAGNGPAWRIEAAAAPTFLSLSSDREARIDIQVHDEHGTPVSGARLEVLARHGRVSPVREIGAGRYTATYRAPEKRYPQLEILAVRAVGHSLAWLAIPLHGTGKLEAETVPGASVTLVVDGREFGPVQADGQGLVRIPFEAPPGVGTGTLVTRTGKQNGARKSIDLGVPLVKPVLAFTRATELVADGRSSTTVEIYLLDRDNRPLSGARPLLSADAGEVSAPLERGPGWYSARFRAPRELGSGTAGIQVSLDGRGDGYRQALAIRLKPGPPARLTVTARPPELPADGRSRAAVEIRVEDETGNPVSEVEVRIRTSAGSFSPVEQVGQGLFAAWLTAPGEPPAAEEITVTAETVKPGAPTLAATTTVKLLRTPEEPFWASRTFYAWTALGTGLAAVVPGALLVGLDGKETCDSSPQRCPEVYDTLTPGAVLLGLGSALLTTSLVLYLLGEPDREAASASIQIVPGEGQLLLSGTWRF